MVGTTLPSDLVLDRLAANIMIADDDLNIVYVNPAVVAMLTGIEADIRRDLPNFDVRNLVGANIDEFHKRPAYQRGVLRGLRGQHKARIVVGGRVLRFTSTSLDDGEGRRIGYAVEWFDVTTEERLEGERAAAEAQRDAHATMLQGIIENSQSAIHVKHLDGRYLLVNGAFQDVVGMRGTDLVGRTDDFLEPDVAAAWHENDRQAREGAVHAVEYTGPTTGDRILESAKFPLHDAEGRLYATCGVSLDVTELRRTAELAERARDEAVRQSQAKSAFVATMSHEIRTPLNAVIGMAGLLMDTRLDGSQREFAETIRDSGEALLSLINDILDYSKIEAGDLELESRQFDLRECLESAVALVTLAAHEKGLELVVDIDPACPAVVVGDDNRIRQVVVNLVSNAVKFTHAGEVVLRARTSREPGGVRLRVEVSDTGIGIPPDGLERVFESFSQVDSSTTRVYGGTGLGLTISRRLARAMAGDLTVRSTVGEGSTFTITALLAEATGGTAGATPAIRDPAWDDRTSRSAEARLTGRHALVVDDNAANRRVLRLQLENWGMTCVDVADPAEALRLFQDAGPGARTPFDVAVLDMNMPGVSGPDLARAVRRTDAGAGLPMILLSSVQSHGPADDPPLFSAVLTKPARLSVLRDRLVAACAPAGDPKRTGGAPGDAGGDPVTGGDDGPAGDADDGRRAGLRILLAEDNPVNQRVTILMLDRLGYRADVVPNGREAVSAVHREAYDVVLMDLHMPEMDGLTATRAIRAGLPPEEQPYIVALTASALTDDLEASRAAGMNAHLAKPTRVKELETVLEHVLHAVGAARGTDAAGPAEGVLDHAVLPRDAGTRARSPVAQRSAAIREQLGELASGDPAVDRRLFDNILTMFLEHTPPLLRRLHSAAADGDTRQLAQLAHTLRGSAANLAMTDLCEACRSVEECAVKGDGVAAASLVPSLDVAYDVASEAAEVLRAQLAIVSR